MYIVLISSRSIIPHPISDSIWLKRGSLLVGAGHIMLLYGHKKPEKGGEVEPGLFETVARYNGPLDDYHPQMILQCLLWGTRIPCGLCIVSLIVLAEKVELVKTIIIDLAKYLAEHEEIREWHNAPVEEYLKKDEVVKAVRSLPRSFALYSIEPYVGAFSSTETSYATLLTAVLVTRSQREVCSVLHQLIDLPN